MTDRARTLSELLSAAKALAVFLRRRLQKIWGSQKACHSHSLLL